MTAVDDRSGTEGNNAGADNAAETDAPRPKIARYVALAVGVLLILFIALLATRPAASDNNSAANALVGHQVPALSGTTLDGKTVSVDLFRGKWVLVNFVADWCTACEAEHPDLKAFQEAHQDDVQVLGVSFNATNQDKLRAFFAKNGGNWPVIASDDGRSAIDFGVTAVPETFVVAPSQTVVAHAEGVTKEWLEDVLAQGKARLAQEEAQTSTTTAKSTASNSTAGAK